LAVPANSPRTRLRTGQGPPKFQERNSVLKNGRPSGTAFPSLIIWSLRSCWWKTFRSPRKGGERGEEKRKRKKKERGKKGGKVAPSLLLSQLNVIVNIGANIIYA